MKNHYRCVNCGKQVDALYKTYGPSVLKLTKCVKCKGFVDKYIEYDPVIVVIDLVLMSKEAQRHILYNTEFKSYWKLFIILLMLETYGLWRRDSLFNIVINSVCGIQANSTINITELYVPIENAFPESWKNNCCMWIQDVRADETDLFIWEKDFYVQFIATFTGIVVFILNVNIMMRITRLFMRLNEVSLAAALKGFSLGNVSVAAWLPALVWGGEAARTRVTHALLAAAADTASRTAVYTVLYECPIVITLLTVIIGQCAKYATYFHITPYLREFIS